MTSRGPEASADYPNPYLEHFEVDLTAEDFTSGIVASTILAAKRSSIYKHIQAQLRADKDFSALLSTEDIARHVALPEHGTPEILVVNHPNLFPIIARFTPKEPLNDKSVLGEVDFNTTTRNVERIMDEYKETGAIEDRTILGICGLHYYCLAALAEVRDSYDASPWEVSVELSVATIPKHEVDGDEVDAQFVLKQALLKYISGS